MIAVDTSVWIAFLRGGSPGVERTMFALIDADAVLVPRPVKVELLGGVGAQTVSRLERALDAAHQVLPSADTWALVERWAITGARQGHRFGLGDLLIAACAAERGAQLWTLDADFTPMERLRWVKLYRGPKG